MTVGHALDERRPVACPRPRIGIAGGAVDDVGVVAVDDDPIQPVRRRTVRGRMLHRGHAPDRRVLHVKVVLADEDHGQLPHRREVQRLVEGADIGGAVAEEADRHIVVTPVLSPPRCTAGDGEVRPDDRIGPHHPMFGGGEVHRAALAAEQTAFTAHQFAEHLLDRHAARQRVGMTAIGAERQVARLHRAGKTGRDRLLAEREMARALDQVLEEEVVGTLLRLPDHELQAEEFQAEIFADVIVARQFGLRVASLSAPCFVPALAMVVSFRLYQVGQLDCVAAGTARDACLILVEARRNRVFSRRAVRKWNKRAEIRTKSPFRRSHSRRWRRALPR